MPGPAEATAELRAAEAVVSCTALYNCMECSNSGEKKNSLFRVTL